MQKIGDILVSVTVGGQTSRTRFVKGCDDQKTDRRDVSQHFLRWSKDRRLGPKPNSFIVGRQTDFWDSSQSIVLGIFCANKLRVSQFWEHRN